MPSATILSHSGDKVSIAADADRVKSGFGSSWDRLAKIKKKYDPNNLFRMNQNITG